MKKPYPSNCVFMIWVGFLFPFILTLAQEGDYELEKVRGMEAFAGSAEARLLLRQNGFVVADPMFKQIFEAYIKSPEIEPPSEDNPHGSILPVFITTDSAWHTYHLLLEEGVRELEAIQAERLLRFSRRLLAATQTRAPQLGPSAGLLRRYASVGLALQEAAHRQTLTGPEKNSMMSPKSRVTIPDTRFTFMFSERAYIASLPSVAMP